MNTVLEYDGSFPGFLCALAESLNRTREGGASAMQEPSLRRAGSCAGLFERVQAVPRDDARARSLWARLSARLGAEVMLTLLEAFSSDLAGADDATAAMARRLWREGSSALDRLAAPEAALLEKAACRTRAEAHLMKGLVRFSELADGSWYAQVEPDCDVLPLIANHFASRFPAMRWAIRDRRRDTAIVHEPGAGWTLAQGLRVGRPAIGAAERGDAEGQDDSALPLSHCELELREAWSGYFRSVAIGERENPALQRSHVPLKYRGGLPEFAGSPPSAR